MGNTGKAGPSRAWFILPCILVLAALFLVGLGLSSFLHFVRTDFVAYQPGSSISVTKDGFTLYTEEGTTGPADLRCTATGPDATVQLRPIAGRTILSNGQGTFVAIASTPQDLPSGRYVISCVSTSTVADIPLFLGPHIDLAAVARLIAFNILAPALLAFCGVVLFVFLAILGYRSSRIHAQTV
jgi:ABC-type sugar transport system permease subunit